MAGPAAVPGPWLSEGYPVAHGVAVHVVSRASIGPGTCLARHHTAGGQLDLGLVVGHQLTLRSA